MGLLLNRVKANTTTTGTSAATPGAAYSAAFQTWSAAGATSGYYYDYLIEDGISNWELGTGLYNGTTITRPGPGSDANFASSSGSLLSLSGGATISSVANKNTLNPNANPYQAFSTMPLLANMTQVNIAGTRFVTEYPGNAVVVGDTAINTTLQTHGVAYTHGLTAPYRVVLACVCLGRLLNYASPCVGWRESSSGKLVQLNYLTNAGGYEYQTWASGTSRASTATATNSSTAPPSNRPVYNMTWSGLRDDGTTVYYEVSPTGNKNDWFIVHQVTKSGSYLSTYDQIFFGMQQTSATVVPWKTIWRTYDPNGLSRTY